MVALLTDAETGSREVVLDVAGTTLLGDLVIPVRARGLVLFAHGSGSSRRSARNRAVAATLQGAGLATLLFDLLSEDEGLRRDLVFDVTTLAQRLEAVTAWARREPTTRSLPLGYFGASTGAAAALLAAADLTSAVSAIVSRGGRPDLAGDRLHDVTAPTLLIVGGADTEVLELNRRSAALLRCPHRLVVVPGAGHLFAEPGALERVAEVATDWFTTHLDTTAAPAVVGA